MCQTLEVRVEFYSFRSLNEEDSLQWILSNLFSFHPCCYLSIKIKLVSDVRFLAELLQAEYKSSLIIYLLFTNWVQGPYQEIQAQGFSYSPSLRGLFGKPRACISWYGTSTQLVNSLLHDPF